MLKKIRNINSTLFELLLGISFYGIVCVVIGSFFVKDKSSFFIGLFFGILIAMLMAVHMAWSLGKAMGFQEASAASYMKKHNLLRYGVLVICLAVIMVTEVGNPLATFMGIMGLKAGAYLAPVFLRITNRFFPNETKWEKSNQEVMIEEQKESKN